jgi:signal transduction histidine kinase
VTDPVVGAVSPKDTAPTRGDRGRAETSLGNHHAIWYLDGALAAGRSAAASAVHLVRVAHLTARAHSGRIEVRVIDCGPGVPEADRDKMFAPFQRLGETGSTTGVGLGLAVSRGLTEATRGRLQPAQTPPSHTPPTATQSSRTEEHE